MNPFEVVSLAQCRHCRALVVTVDGRAWNPSLGEVRELRELLARWEGASGFRLAHWFSTFGGINSPHSCPECKIDRVRRRRRERGAPALGVAFREHRARAPWPQPHETEPGPEPGPGPLAFAPGSEPPPAWRGWLARPVRAAIGRWIADHPDADPPGLLVAIETDDEVSSIRVMMSVAGLAEPLGCELDLRLGTQPPEICERLVCVRLEWVYRRLWELANGRG